MADTKDPPPWLRAGLYPFPVTEHVRPDHLQPDDLGKSRHGESALKILTVLWQASDDEYLTVVMVTASREVFPVRVRVVDHPVQRGRRWCCRIPRIIFQPSNSAVSHAPSHHLGSRSTMSFDEVPLTPPPLPHQPPVLDRSADDAGRSPADRPRLREYIDQLRTKVPPTTLATYESSWRVISQVWGERQLSEPTTEQIEELMEAHQIRSRGRANSRGGHAAAENLLSAMRRLYKHAERDRLIDPSSNPAAAAKLPGRRTGQRRRSDQRAAAGRSSDRVQHR
ncbi:hypothetical protein [Nocardia sp. NPDC047648]|uniref:hypothetical protein n=1 Tax=Nocardia sp. NPDC047648 TaxID=3155625 RepID=UPI0033F3BB0D